MLRPNKNTIEGYFLAGKYMFWLPVSIKKNFKLETP